MVAQEGGERVSLENKENESYDDFPSGSECSSNDATTDERINNIKEKNLDFCADFMLTNARSLAPKITSLLDCMIEREIDIAAITETWFKSGQQLEGELIDVEEASGFKLLLQNRRKGSKRGGGVALCFNKNACTFKKKNLTGSKFEILCCVGKVRRIERKIVIFTVYVPPQMKVGELRDLNNFLAIKIAEVKVGEKNPIVVVCGDFNNRDISPAMEGVDGFREITSGPTRANRCLDKIFVNLDEGVGEAEVLPPLETEEGVQSDHSCVRVLLSQKKSRNFEWIKREVRKRSGRANEKFVEDMIGTDWQSLSEKNSVDEMVEELEKRIVSLTDRHFPMVTIRARSNEKPWVTNGIRRRSKKKKRVYREEGRSPRWRGLCEEMEEEIRQKKSAFVDKVLEDGNTGKSYYSAVKNLAGPNGKKSWDVTDLFLDASSGETGERILDYFGSVGEGAETVEMPVVPEGGAGMDVFDEEKVLKMLKKHKKTTSSVPGDPLPHLVREFPTAFVRPLTIIYNKMNETAVWPMRWKTEYLTIIPKVPNPADLSECRNISCTALFSKVMENEFLNKIRGEVEVDERQFGGQKGLSADHLLADIWEDIVNALEGGERAAVILGLDFEKAFNRMQHGVCLDQFIKLGGSVASARLIKSFLTGRRMTIKIGKCFANYRDIVRGSPQGSVMGCFLYCIATQHLTRNLAVANPGRADFPHQQHSPPAVQFGFPYPQVPDEGGRIRYFPRSEGSSSEEEGVEFWENQETPDVMGEGVQEVIVHQEGDVTDYKYIDDTTLLEVCPLAEGVRHLTTGPTIETLTPAGLSGSLLEMIRRSDDIGMLINCKKTQLLCVSPNNGCITEAAIAHGDDVIRSVDKLKLVGFTFGTRADVAEHIEELKKKFRIRIWMLYHLREAGIKGKPLYRLYCCYIRSVMEYCSPVYHAIINGGQSADLEHMHRLAITVCYGGNVEVRGLMADLGIETLEARRIRRTDSFVAKAVRNPRLAESWFPLRPDNGHNLRVRRPFLEESARTSRKFNSPIAYYRRRANDLGIQPI